MEEVDGTERDVSVQSDSSVELFFQALAKKDWDVTVVCNEAKRFTFSLKELDAERRLKEAFYMFLIILCVSCYTWYMLWLITVSLFKGFRYLVFRNKSD